MLLAIILFIIASFFINYLIVSYVINGPLNPTKLSGSSGSTGIIGYKGRKGVLGLTGPTGFDGAGGPTKSPGSDGPIGVRGSFFKIGNTSNACRNNPQCAWHSQSTDWRDKSNALGRDPLFRASSTFAWRGGGSAQDNLKDFWMGDDAMTTNEPVIQLRPCITCNNCDPPPYTKIHSGPRTTPEYWDDIIGNPYSRHNSQT